VGCRQQIVRCRGHPGIIEGAHEGGARCAFLQHVERTRAVAVLVPVDSPDPQATYDLLRKEAASYSKELASKPHVGAHESRSDT